MRLRPALHGAGCAEQGVLSTGFHAHSGGKVDMECRAGQCPRGLLPRGRGPKRTQNVRGRFWLNMNARPDTVVQSHHPSQESHSESEASRYSELKAQLGYIVSRLTKKRKEINQSCLRKGLEDKSQTGKCKCGPCGAVISTGSVFLPESQGYTATGS